MMWMMRRSGSRMQTRPGLVLAIFATLAAFSFFGLFLSQPFVMPFSSLFVTMVIFMMFVEAPFIIFAQASFKRLAKFHLVLRKRLRRFPFSEPLRSLSALIVRLRLRELHLWRAWFGLLIIEVSVSFHLSTP